MDLNRRMKSRVFFFFFRSNGLPLHEKELFVLNINLGLKQKFIIYSICLLPHIWLTKICNDPCAQRYWIFL